MLKFICLSIVPFKILAKESSRELLFGMGTHLIPGSNMNCEVDL